MRPAGYGPGARLGRAAVAWTILLVVATSAAVVAVRAVGGSGVAATGRRPTQPRSKSRPPNIVLIVTDDQRWNSLFAMPNVERYIVKRGVTFTNAFVTTSFCCPSRASILTGQYSRHTGVYSDSGPHGGAPAFKDASTLATWLHGAGYDTALVGKYLNSYNLIPHHIPPGWSQWDAAVSPDPALHYYHYALNENGRRVNYGGLSGDYVDTVLGHLGTQFLATARPPFFLEFCPTAPHAPAIPAPGDERRFRHFPLPYRPNFNEADVSDKPWDGMFPRYQRTGFITRFWDQQLESLQQVDRTVGAFVRVLRLDGQLANTVFIFTTDNGILLGEHRLAIVKIWPYEESIRVPFVIGGAGILDPGRTNPDFALNIDIAPTIAQLAGVRPGLPEDGRSLVPLLRDQHPSWRTSFVVEYLGKGGPDDKWVAPFEGIRTLRYLYVRYGMLRLVHGGPLVHYPNGSEELYDLKTDRYELHNLAALPRYKRLRDQLAAQLRRLLDA